MSKQPDNVNNSRKAREFKKREREILHTALQQFCGDDWESVTVAQIALEVGIAKGTMYLHFESKHEIYARLALDFYRSLSLVLSEPLHGDAADQLRQLITRAFEFHIERPAYRRVTQYCEREDFRRTVKDDIARELEDIDNAIETIICKVLQQGIEEGAFTPTPVPHLLLCLQCTFKGALMRLWSSQPTPLKPKDDLVDTVTNYMVDTIINRKDSSDVSGSSKQQDNQLTTKPSSQSTTENQLELTA